MRRAEAGGDMRAGYGRVQQYRGATRLLNASDNNCGGLRCVLGVYVNVSVALYMQRVLFIRAQGECTYVWCRAPPLGRRVARRGSVRRCLLTGSMEPVSEKISNYLYAVSKKSSLLTGS